MLERIANEDGSAAKFVERAKDKNDTHAADGLRPPRLQELRSARRDPQEGLRRGARDRLGVDEPLLEIAMELEEIALHDDYFISRKLYPNVDFYSGIIYKAIGIPVNMFTVMFAIGRLPGWIAQWLEMRSDPETRIVRPRQLYVGATQRPYVPLEKRA